MLQLLFLSFMLSTTVTTSLFAIRGFLPWHNFLSGPSAWNLVDYQNFFDMMTSSNFNFIGFHSYTGGTQRYNIYKDPLIKTTYQNILPAAYLDTSLSSHWGYRPLTTDQFAFNTSKLYSSSVFGADCVTSLKPGDSQYDSVVNFMNQVFQAAKTRGIKTCIGFELGVWEPEIYSVVPYTAPYNGDGVLLANPYIPNPFHPAAIRLLQTQIQSLLTSYPTVDFVWFWMEENPLEFTDYKPPFSGQFGIYYDQTKGNFSFVNNPILVFYGVWLSAYITQARTILHSLQPDLRMIVSGWGGDNQLTPLLPGLHSILPLDVTLSCLSPNGGQTLPPTALQNMGNRSIWILPWLEDDGHLWTPEPRVQILRDQVNFAKQTNAEGLIALHWRTADIQMNFDALNLFKSQAMADLPFTNVSQFYTDWTREMYGSGDAVTQLASIFTTADQKQTLPSSSPEYFSYDPNWGRLTSEQISTYNQLITTATVAISTVDSSTHLYNLQNLTNTYQFGLLFDQVSSNLSLAYNLRNDATVGAVTNKTQQCNNALTNLNNAPIASMFNTYMNRVQSRGELGVLSAMNQKLWLEYLDLQNFIKSYCQ